jgi:hypothetical protein
MSRAIPPVAPLFILLALACATAPPKPPSPNRFSKRAAIDLNCPAGEVMATNIDENTVGVRGCGRRTVYVSICENRRPPGRPIVYEEELCRWLRQGEIETDRPQE